MADEIFISTAMVETGARSDFWREATKPVFETSLLPDQKGAQLEGALRSRQLASLLIGRTSFNGQRYIRDRRIILQSDLDIYMVQVSASGSMTGDFNGRDVSATAGDICIQDLTQPFASQVDAGSRLSTAIPRHELERHVGPRNLHGVVLKAVWPMTRLITTYLEGLVSLQETLGGPQALAAQEALITLLASALTAEMLDQTHEQAPLAVALRQRVLMFIQQNLHAKDLSPETIQRQFNVSRAHPYRAYPPSANTWRSHGSRCRTELSTATAPSRSWISAP